MNARSGASLWGFLLITPAIFLLFAGVRAWQAMTGNQVPSVVTYAQFVQKMPQSGWYTITGAVVDVTKSVYWEQNGVCVDVFAPLQPANGAFSRSPDVYVEIDDSPTLSAMIDMNHARHNGGEQAARTYVAQHRDIFLQRREISGLVSYGRRDPMGEWSQAGVNAATVTFIADGWKPNPLLSYAGTGLGALLTLLSVGLLIKGWLASRR